ncbi:MAG: hypothetical protein VX447_00985 [Pseudomonadota bacterium]|uniref:hypothetical protein n=1 Tax=Gallaecimonas pentaromativorans TaxID=584787 RepID=UPI00067EAEAE|nr:hypothetical protein [Gallaecimonas pentaromativorans]MED5523319.1 hypothetical protein [Pseudomonadota bacterium]
MKNLVLCLLTTLLLLGCQTTKRQALAPQNNASLNDSVIIQDQSAQLLGARYGGDTSERAAVITLAPVQAQMQRFMFQTSFKHKLRKAFWDHEQLRGNKIIEVDDPASLTDLFAVRGVDGKNVLKLTPSYTLSSDRRHLQLTLLAEYFEPPKKSRFSTEKTPRVLYRNTFYFQSPALAFTPRKTRNNDEIAAERKVIDEKYYALKDKATDGYQRLQLSKDQQRELDAIETEQDEAGISKQYSDFLNAHQDWLIDQANQGMTEVIEMMLYDIATPALPDMDEASQFPAPKGRQWQRLSKREGRNLVSTASGESFNWGDLAHD